MKEFPFQELPTELLIDIFKLCESPSHARDLIPIVVTISHVCQFWRSTAIDAPTLWSEVYIHTLYPGTLRIASLFLDRSNQCLLDTSFHAFFAEGFCEPPETIMAEMLIPHVERWRSFRIMVDNADTLSETCILLREVHPHQLQVLEIASFHGYVRVHDTELPSESSMLTGNSPRLHTVRISGALAFFSHPSFVNLESLVLILEDVSTFEWMHLNDVLTCISHSLAYLRLEIPFSDQYIPRNARKIEFPVLKVLDILSNPMLLIISAPQLEMLSFRECDDRASLEAIFTKTSFPLLSSLALSEVWPDQFVPSPDFFLEHPLLESISFSKCEELERMLLDFLVPKTTVSAGEIPDHTVSVPNLQSLTISDISNWPRVQTILASRISRESRSIRSVKVPPGAATEGIRPHLETWLGERNITLEVVGRFPVWFPVFSQALREIEWQEATEEFQLEIERVVG